MYCVYKHTGPTGKVYIGITKRKPQKRWNSGRGYIENRYFWRAIQKYGWDSFSHEILETNLTLAEAEEKERYYIRFYDSTNPEHGYNIEAGGVYGPEKFTEEMRQTFSDRGKRVAEEHSELMAIMRDAQREYFSDPENRKKHSDTLKRYYQAHPEARERISKENKARWTDSFRESFGATQRAAQGTPEARRRARNTHKAQMRPVEQIALDGHVVAQYECIGDAVRTTGICRQNIMCALKHKKTKAGNERQTAGGYKWRYLDEW